MFQPPLPPNYSGLSPAEAADAIAKARQALGESVVILGHHYQRDEIIRWADHIGDSFKLSRVAASGSWPTVVFCGVHFMAESADILTSDDQTVILPNLSAGCSMADMAGIGQVERAWREIEANGGTEDVVPITYVNSTAAIKAFVGRHGGACCTSSNARQVLEWALQRGRRVLFFPDQHLARNTGVGMGLDAERDMTMWDPALPVGGNTAERLAASTLILWKGHCSVHMRFTVEQIAQARAAYPGVRVIVHPECTLDVVRAADLNGSTEAIVAAITASEPGSVWGVGTEINLVHRLAERFPDRTVLCLDPVVCPCSTMYRIHPRYLAWVLGNLAEGRVVNRIAVPPDVKPHARAALERMLEIA